MTVDILCRVVDNLGDIGFAYRLARALSELPDSPRLRLVVDDLGAFAGICPGVDPEASFQAIATWEIARWDSPGDRAIEAFLADRPRVVLECYACGRPDWFEDILFDESDPEPRRIINLEYLTAEAWSAEYHLLPSLTRSPLVSKAVFMPGFRPGTGGLLQDKAFIEGLDAGARGNGPERAASRARRRIEALAEVCDLKKARSRDTEIIGSVVPEPRQEGLESAFWVFVFSYEHDYGALVADLTAFAAERPVLALVAAGRSADPFFSAWERAGRPFPALALPMVGQTLWDRLFVASDFLIVRGEESLSRAVLSALPFLWECYPFTEADGETAGHLGKVWAFLDLLRPLVEPAYFKEYERLTLRFNGVGKDSPLEGSVSEVSPEKRPDSRILGAKRSRVEPLSGDFLRILRWVAADTDVNGRLEVGVSLANTDVDGSNTDVDGSNTGDILPESRNLTGGFRKFAQNARDLGNLAANLMTFIRVSG